MNSPLNSKNQGYGKASRWGNSRLASRSPSMASRSPSNTHRGMEHGGRTTPHSNTFSEKSFRPRWGRKGSGKGGQRKLRNFSKEHEISSVSSSPLPQRSLTPQRTSMSRHMPGIPGNSKAYSRPCKYFAVGKCMKGASCTFLHDFVPSRQGNEMKAHPRNNRRSPASFQLNRPPRRHPAPLNLNDDDLESTYFNRPNLRPVSPANHARSRPSSRSNQARLGNGGGPIGFHFSNDQDRLDTILKGLQREEFQQDERVDNNAGEEPNQLPPKETTPRTFDFNVKVTDNREIICEEMDKNIIQPQTPLTPSKAFTRPCKYYAQGFCVKGASCTFLHSTQDSIAISDRLNQVGGKDSTGNPVFVRLCRYYIKGQCAKGADCTFIHPTPEQLEHIKLKQSVSPPCSPISSPKIVNSVHPGLTRPHSVPAHSKTNRLTLPRPNSLPHRTQSQSPRLCINANVSPHRLSMGEGFNLGENGSLLCTNINQNKAKTKPCKFFAVGQCLKGDQCTFIHEKSESRARETSLDLGRELASQSPDLSPTKRVSSPRFARHENRSYSYSELDDIEDYVAGCRDKDAQKSMVANSNVAAVVLTFDRGMRDEINNTLTEIHNMIKELNKDSPDNDYIDFMECYSLGCTTVEPEQVADDVRRSDMDFLGRREALCQPRFGHILRWLKRKGVVGADAAYLYQIEAVSPKYSYKYPYANISMVFQKGDKGERIEDVAIRGLFEKQHVILDRNFWDTAFKARAPPIYLQYFLNLEQLTKYPESRRVWFCGAHSLFVPILRDFELVRLEAGVEWPSGADVPSKYAAHNVPVPTLYIKQRRRNSLLTMLDTQDVISQVNNGEEELQSMEDKKSMESDEVMAMSNETDV